MQVWRPKLHQDPLPLQQQVGVLKVATSQVLEFEEGFGWISDVISMDRIDPPGSLNPDFSPPKESTLL